MLAAHQQYEMREAHEAHEAELAPEPRQPASAITEVSVGHIQLGSPIGSGTYGYVSLSEMVLLWCIPVVTVVVSRGSNALLVSVKMVPFPILLSPLSLFLSGVSRAYLRNSACPHRTLPRARWVGWVVTLLRTACSVHRVGISLAGSPGKNQFTYLSKTSG